jgi:hypothetical protein
MRVLTPDTALTESERYRSLLELHNYQPFKSGDVLIDSVKNGRAGSMNFQNFNIAENCNIYIIPHLLTGAIGIDVAASAGWKISTAKVRILGDKMPTFKGANDPVYSPLRFFGPKNFDCDIRTPVFKKRAFAQDANGVREHAIMQLSAEAGGDVKLAGWTLQNGGFCGVRGFEQGSETDASFARLINSLLIEDMTIDTVSAEGFYLVVRHKYHYLLNQTHINDCVFKNIGAEWLQHEAIGKDSIIENCTVGHSGTEWQGPFQNYQRGSAQLKAQGSFKMRNILIEYAGDPVVNTIAVAPVTNSTGAIIQDGCKPGDEVEFSNIYVEKMHGAFFYQNASCKNGTHWIFDNIHLGEVTKRVNEDTQTVIPKPPYAYFLDPAGTDRVTLKNIYTDGSFPLTGKAVSKFTIEGHTVQEVVKPKYVKGHNGADVISYQQFYNQFSQPSDTIYYPVKGQPTKFREGDIVYHYAPGIATTHWRVPKDITASEPAPTVEAGFEPILNDFDLSQTPDSPLYNIAGVQEPIIDPKDVTIELLTDQLKAAQEMIEALHVHTEKLNATIESLELELSVSETKYDKILNEMTTINNLSSAAITQNI